MTATAPKSRLVTVVATVRTGLPDSTIERTMRASVSTVGILVPCDWAPDADTITDAVGGDPVTVLDLNPPRRADIPASVPDDEADDYRAVYPDPRGAI